MITQNMLSINLFFIFIMCLGCVVTSSSQRNRTHTRRRDFPEVVDLPTNETTKKTILWLDAYHNQHGLRNTYGLAQFDQCVGVARNCEILPHVIARPRLSTTDNFTIGPIQADAVLIMGVHMHRLPVPVRRDANQVFVFVEREGFDKAPTFKDENEIQKLALFQSHIGYFNWTMTYRWDSDILLPYGQVVPKGRQQFRDRTVFEQIYDKKKYDAVWVVSHCSTPSKREHYVKELQLYMDIHIHGKCENSRFSDNEFYLQLLEEHKFIISFENAYQVNYVTEKLFARFNIDIVQVVRGGGIDYTLYGLPANSYIDADDFLTPKELAHFLKKIGNDQNAYVEYLARKDRYITVPQSLIQTSAYCNICAKLQNLNQHRNSYTNVLEWFQNTLYSAEMNWKYRECTHVKRQNKDNVNVTSVQ